MMIKVTIYRFIKFFAFIIFGRNNCKLALVSKKNIKSLPLQAKVVHTFLKILNNMFDFSMLIKYQQSKINNKHMNNIAVYNKSLLNSMLNSVYDLPEVVVDIKAPPRINVLVPAFDIHTISAGFFGVFNTALFIQKQGYRVRLVLFDNFYYHKAEFKKALKSFPSMEDLFEKIEVEYIGERLKPLIVSPKDNCVATVWYSAYFANKISQLIGSRPFLYLIQDFESAFYPSSSNYCVARNTYDFKYHTLASSGSLYEYLNKEKIISSDLKSIYFENACSFSMYDRNTFLLEKSSSKKRRFILYSRPSVSRNMFEMAALAIIEAYESGVFQDSEWEFYGMGIGNVIISLDENIEVKQLPRMSLDEYQKITKTFDLCLTLMSSPHPSLVPIDLAASGAIVITNTFATKTADYLKGISSNIIPVAPELYSLSSAIQQGVQCTRDLDARFEGANVNWPKAWQETWTEQHRDFIKEVFV